MRRNSLLDHAQDLFGTRKVLKMVLDDIPFGSAAVLAIVVDQQQRLPAPFALLSVRGRLQIIESLLLDHASVDVWKLAVGTNTFATAQSNKDWQTLSEATGFVDARPVLLGISGVLAFHLRHGGHKRAPDSLNG
jgi:hypothetical protein